GKGGQGTSIKISFAQDDPLFGAQGPNGPAFSISVGRATVAGQDANGDPNYVNHTSPFIDQSQTYGSVDQITNLLREWVSTDGGVTYHAGLELFDGQSLVDAWMRKVPVFDPLTGLTNIVETPVHDTLPTLSELRQHVLDTDRVALTWDDVVDYRNRSAEGTSLSGGTSGHALILDMNPRFDKAHLSPDDGDLLTAWDATVAASVEAAVTTLSAAGATGSPDLAFTAVRDNTNAIVNIQLVVTNNAGGPFLPNGTYTGASALAAWVDFSTFGIMTAPPGVDPLMLDSVRAAVGDLLMASVGDHYIAGDGRVNENFGLTSIHHVFHEEHNFQVENLKSWIYAHDENNPGSLDAHEQLHNWQVDTGNGTDVNGNYIYANGEIAWDADKMFEATKLVVEMEYQHAAVDQYARTVTPRIQEFVGYSTGVDPTVSLEYAQVAFRFGHSTIRETIDAIDPDGWMLGNVTRYALEKAFLNPQQFAETGVAAITLGLSRQQMNEVDEFVTPALNQGLLGQPLDLPAINIARGRDLGIPTLNDFRAAISLAEYTSWADYGVNMVHPESLVNFIAAYSFSDPSGVTPIEVSQAKAQYIIDLANGAPAGTNPFGTTVITQEQAQAFLTNNAVVGNDELNAARMGFDQIDAWIGGMAEAHVPGGILGETFDAVFVAQIQSLMDGDRFYYLYRLFGTQIHEEVNNGQFKDIVERNTGLTHLNGSIFAYADKYYDFNRNADGLMPDGSVILASDDLDEHLYAASLAANPGIGIYSDGGFSTNVNGSPISVLLSDYVRLPETLAFIQDVRPDLNPAQVHAEGTPTSG
ncbi:MAG: peroxidase family protein, partial [Hyphomicrobium sp.]